MQFLNALSILKLYQTKLTQHSGRNTDLIRKKNYALKMFMYSVRVKKEINYGRWMVFAYIYRFILHNYAVSDLPRLCTLGQLGKYILMWS